MIAGMDSQELDVYFPDLARGRLNIAPPRALGPQSQQIYRDSLNFVPRDGLMKRRAGLGSLPTTTKSLPPSVYDLTAGTNGERPVFCYTNLAPVPQTFASVTGGLNNLIPYRSYTVGSGAVAIVVTNRSAYIYNDMIGAWMDVTPSYSTGTIQVANGSAAIIGTGTAWLIRGISPFQHIKIGAVWYQIYQVVDDTHISLSQVYASTNASGLAYTISRTWGMGNSAGDDRSAQVYCRVYNQTLLIGGTFVGRADGIPTPTVIQVAGILTSSPTTTYLTSSVALVAGLDLITAGSISGLGVLQDSRVVITGDQSTLFYSSNLVNTVWSASPAGFTVVEHDSGAIHSLGILGSNLTLHFELGIVYGIPTGQADPPLSFVDSGATVGCVCPFTLKEWQRQQFFVGFDGNVHVFDGSTTREIGGDIKNDPNLSSGAPIEDLKNKLFAGINTKWGEYTLYKYSLTSFTPAWTMTADGSWWPQKFPAPIGAVSDEDALSGSRTYSIAGLYTKDQSTEKNMLWTLSVGVSTDSIIYSSMDSGGHFLEFDDQDYDGLAQKAYLTYKTFLSAVVWFRSGTQLADTDTIHIDVSRDGGATWVSAVSQLVSVPATGESVAQFSFIDTINAALILRFRLVADSSTTTPLAPTRVVFTSLAGGDADLGVLP